MHSRSLILLLVAACALHVGAVRAQIAEESSNCIFESYTESHYLSLQPSYNLRWDGQESNAVGLEYFVMDYSHVNGLAVGADLRFTDRQTPAVYLDYVHFLTQGPSIRGAYVAGGFGVGFAEKPQLEVRLGFGYALPLDQSVSMIFSLTNRIVGVHPFSNIGANVVSGLSVGFAFRLAETEWGLW